MVVQRVCKLVTHVFSAINIVCRLVTLVQYAAWSHQYVGCIYVHFVYSALIFIANDFADIRQLSKLIQSSKIRPGFD